MRLSRREILEELVRLGIRDVYALRKACREFEKYWDGILARKNRYGSSCDMAGALVYTSQN